MTAAASLTAPPGRSGQRTQLRPLASARTEQVARRQARQIICFGGFPGAAADNPLHSYVLASTGKRRPRVCLLLSRGGDISNLADLFYRAFQSPRCEPSHLLAEERNRNRDPRLHLSRQDVILVGGGSLIRVLGLWRLQGIDSALREAWRSGTVLCGFRAGALCWFAEAVTSLDGELRAARGLGLLPFSACVHYGGQPARRAAYRSHLLRGMRPGYAVEEGAALHFVGGRVHSAVTAVSGRRAFSVRAEQGEIVEEPLPTASLCNGNPRPADRVEPLPGVDDGPGA